MEADVAAIAPVPDPAARLERGQEFLTRMLSGDANADEPRRRLPAGRYADAAAPVMTQPYAEVEAAAVLAERAQAAHPPALSARPERCRRSASTRPASTPLPRSASAVRSSGRRRPTMPIRGSASCSPPGAQLEQLERGVVAIPSARPIHDSPISPAATASAPILSAAAPRCMPASISPARSAPRSMPPPTASSAAPNGTGGYGNLVEINHGRGIQTRYGHLSQLIVRPASASGAAT